MEVKWVKEDELDILNPIIEQHGWTPIPRNSLALVAIDEDGLAGFHILRLVQHAEPLWVRPDLRGSGLAADLAGGMSHFLEDSGFMVIADDPSAVKLCESLGMKRINSPVFVR